jgi:hypothetical protein
MIPSKKYWISQLHIKAVNIYDRATFNNTDLRTDSESSLTYQLYEKMILCGDFGKELYSRFGEDNLNPFLAFVRETCLRQEIHKGINLIV